MPKINEHTIILRCTTAEPISTDEAVRRLDRALLAAFKRDKQFDRDFTTMISANYVRVAGGLRKWGLNVVDKSDLR